MTAGIGEGRDRTSRLDRSFFEQEESRGISAVLYSTSEAFNCYGIAGSELMLIHNPLATSPLPRGYLRIGRECWREGNRLVIHDHNGPAEAGTPERAGEGRADEPERP